MEIPRAVSVEFVRGDIEFAAVAVIRNEMSRFIICQKWQKPAV
jgi:hypothetical protein